jgi:hypothetical protein
MVINSPAEIPLPSAPVALLKMMMGVGVAAAVRFSDTVTVRGVARTPGAVIMMVPASVDPAVALEGIFAGTIETLIVWGV